MHTPNFPRERRSNRPPKTAEFFVPANTFRALYPPENRARRGNAFPLPKKRRHASRTAATRAFGGIVPATKFLRSRDSIQ